VDEAIRDLLEGSDDPVNEEEPPDLDRHALRDRVDRLGQELSQILGSSFAVIGWGEIQDATFCCELLVRGIRVRFSNFGSLITITKPGPERVDAQTMTQIVQAASAAGFHFVSKDVLETPYTGRNPQFVGATWFGRFFDYV
jgi:hypothetical protein